MAQSVPVLLLLARLFATRHMFKFVGRSWPIGLPCSFHNHLHRLHGLQDGQSNTSRNNCISSPSPSLSKRQRERRGRSPVTREGRRYGNSCRACVSAGFPDRPTPRPLDVYWDPVTERSLWLSNSPTATGTLIQKHQSKWKHNPPNTQPRSVNPLAHP